MARLLKHRFDDVSACMGAQQIKRASAPKALLGRAKPIHRGLAAAENRLAQVDDGDETGEAITFFDAERFIVGQAAIQGTALGYDARQIGQIDRRIGYKFAYGPRRQSALDNPRPIQRRGMQELVEGKCGCHMAYIYAPNG